MVCPGTRWTVNSKNAQQYNRGIPVPFRLSLINHNECTHPLLLGPAVKVRLPADDEAPAPALAHRERHQALTEPGLHELQWGRCSLKIQGDHSACAKPPVDIDVKVAF